MIALILLALQFPGMVRGQVRSEPNGAQLAGAIVEWVRGAGAGSHTVSTDSAGNYLLRAVPAGRAKLRAYRLDHEPFEVEVLVPSGGEVALDFALRPRPPRLSEVRVRGNIERGIEGAPETDTLPPPRPAVERAEMKALEGVSGITELGLGERPQNGSGPAPVDPSDVLYIRGGAADLKLVLLDGAPVYTPFHLGGLLDPFEPGALRSATLYLGGAPAQHDGGLSYVLALNTRPARGGRVRSSGAVDLISGRTIVEGPLGDGAGFLLSGRAVHWLAAGPLLRNSAPYGYMDGLARFDTRIGKQGLLSFTGFGNREKVWLDTVGVDGASAGWGNRAGSVRYRDVLGDTDAEIGIAASQFDATLPVGEHRLAPTEGATDRVRVTADLGREAGPVRLRFGGSFDRTVFRYQMRNGTPSVSGDATGGYVDGSWQPMARLRLRGGLRTDLFSVNPEPRFAGRFSATWLLSDRAALSAAAGSYHQYVRAPFADTVTFTPTLAVGHASHFTVGLHQELDAGVRLGVEGFFKTFGGIPAPAAGQARASGMDLWARRETGSVRGWLGYSLSWAWSPPADGTVAERFDGRQLVSAGATGTLGRWADVDFRIAYGAGLPFSAINLQQDGADPANSPSPEAGPVRLETGSATDTPPLAEPPTDPYLRLDLGISRTFAPRWAGVPMEITPYFKMLNALDRRDAVFYRYEGGSGAAPEPVTAFPVLPLLGVQWKF